MTITTTRMYDGRTLTPIDVYPVGVLRGLLVVRRALNPRAPLVGHRWAAVHHGIAYLRRCWRSRAAWNGYLAEPLWLPEGLPKIGHGWTKRRAVRRLYRYWEPIR